MQSVFLEVAPVVAEGSSDRLKEIESLTAGIALSVEGSPILLT